MFNKTNFSKISCTNLLKNATARIQCSKYLVILNLPIFNVHYFHDLFSPFIKWLFEYWIIYSWVFFSSAQKHLKHFFSNHKTTFTYEHNHSHCLLLNNVIFYRIVVSLHMCVCVIGKRDSVYEYVFILFSGNTYRELQATNEYLLE